MKIGIMQPYFFPYLGYFHLIQQSDLWIIFDTVQYIRHGWINRNRVLHPREGWQYVCVPLQKHSRDALIRDVLISKGSAWKMRILGQLEHYKKKALYYSETRAFVEKCLLPDFSKISELNCHLLKETCNYLEVDFEYEVHSALGLDLGPIEGPGDWALRICQALGADAYINPPGGADLFSEEKFRRSGIQLEIQSYCNMEYETGQYKYEPALSIIDVLMWNTPQEIRRHLEL